MSQAVAALALFNIPGAANPTAGSALLATGKGEASASPQTADQGFSAFVLAASGLAKSHTAATVAATAIKSSVTAAATDTPVDESPKDETGAQALLAAAFATFPAQAPAPETALGIQPNLPSATPAEASAPTPDVSPDNGFLTDDAKAALIAAAHSDGKAKATPAAATKNGAQTPDSAGTAGAATGTALPTSAALPNTIPEGTPSTDQSATVPTDSTVMPASSAAGTDGEASEVPASDVVSTPLPTDPAQFLSDSAKAVTATAAEGHAVGAQTAVLEAARDLIVATTPEKTKASSTGANMADTEPGAPQVAVAPSSSRPAPEAPAPQHPFKDDLAATHAKADSAPPPPKSTETSPPNPAPASAATTQPGPRTDSATAQSTAPDTPQATTLDGRGATLPAAQADNRPTLPMTVIRADSQGGSTTLPTEQIAITVARQFRQGTNRFEIRLDPPELGRIDVRLDLGHAGRATATLTADRPETLQLLTRDARVLQQTLNDAGLQTDAGSLNFALRDQSGRQHAQDDGEQGKSRARAPSPVKEAEAVTQVQLTATLEPGRLDLRI